MPVRAGSKLRLHLLAMHFHILGFGAVGRLVSHHLRRTIPPSDSVSIIHKTSGHARRFLVYHSGNINVERDGLLTESTGFHSEPFEHNMSYSKERGWIATLPQIESLIVVTKAHQTFNAVKALAPRLSPNATIVLLQNGMGIYEKLIHKLFPNAQRRPHFILCSNTHGVFIKSSGIPVHTGVGQLEIGIAPDPDGKEFEASYRDETVPLYERALSLDDITRPNDPDEIRYGSLRATVAALTSMEDLRVSWKPISDMDVAMRRKLVANAAINTLTALMGCRNGEIIRSESARGFIMKICVEAERVFAAEHAAGARRMLDQFSEQGLNPDNFNVDRLPVGLTKTSLYNEVLRVAGVTHENISSMLLDLRRGKATELDYITGYLLTLGQTYGVRMSRTASIHYLIKARCEIPQDQIL